MVDIEETHKKKQALLDNLRALDSLLVAFSGGVDSTFLLVVAREALGKKVIAVTAHSILYPQREIEEAVAFARLHGIEQVLLASEASCLPEFLANTPERCYVCKKYLFGRLREIAAQRGIRFVAHAANMDDFDDFRPGWNAAVEQGVIAPLVDARLSKEEIRFLSKEMGLSTWDKPSMACLASRIPYGEPITETKLRMIGEAEKEVASHGFIQYRVRHHGPVARVELQVSDMNKIMEPKVRKRIVAKLKELGFLYVTLDLEGYATGSMNRAIEVPKVSKVPKMPKVEKPNQKEKPTTKTRRRSA
jgi:pyridinium-3,5-biscarboxylic acid mononucleotide sulfurtransferase